MKINSALSDPVKDPIANPANNRELMRVKPLLLESEYANHTDNKAPIRDRVGVIANSAGNILLAAINIPSNAPRAAPPDAPITNGSANGFLNTP